MTRQYIDPKKQGIFSKMYQWLEMEPNLSLGAKMVYARLAWYSSNKTGAGWIAQPKQTTLAAALAIPERTCRDYIKELVNFGLLEVKRRGLGRSDHYRFPAHPIMPGVGENPLSEAQLAVITEAEMPEIEPN